MSAALAGPSHYYWPTNMAMSEQLRGKRGTEGEKEGLELQEPGSDL